MERLCEDHALDVEPFGVGAVGRERPARVSQAAPRIAREVQQLADARVRLGVARVQTERREVLRRGVGEVAASLISRGEIEPGRDVRGVFAYTLDEEGERCRPRLVKGSTLVHCVAFTGRMVARRDFV